VLVHKQSVVMYPINVLPSILTMLTYSFTLHVLPCTRCTQVPQSSAAAPAAAAVVAAADAAAVEVEQTEPAPPWEACLSYAEGETVYDVAWYPGMSSAEPASCCFVSTARDHPVHLWCAYTGTLRGTAAILLMQCHQCCMFCAQ
jgi:hypothetical protein